MKKSMLSSVTAAPRSPAPNLSFLFNNRTWIMGVLNVTPDSFYGRSRAKTLTSALAAMQTFIDEGADIIDIGGESTRPGAEEISLTEELARVTPVVAAARARWPKMPLSVDTQKAEVARQALMIGASVVNDISALRHDPEMVDVVAEFGCPVVLMHMQGSPKTMQKQPHYDNVVDEVKHFFTERLAFATRHSIRADRVILDPGIGFGKTLEHNMTLLKHLSDFISLGQPLLLGVSRKSFIGKISASPQPSPVGRGRHSTGEALTPEERLEGSLSAAMWAVHSGVRGLRVHDVGATRRALTVWEGIQSA